MAGKISEDPRVTTVTQLNQLDLPAVDNSQDPKTNVKLSLWQIFNWMAYYDGGRFQVSPSAVDNGGAFYYPTETEGPALNFTAGNPLSTIHGSQCHAAVIACISEPGTFVSEPLFFATAYDVSMVSGHRIQVFVGNSVATGGDAIIPYDGNIELFTGGADGRVAAVMFPIIERNNFSSGGLSHIGVECHAADDTAHAGTVVFPALDIYPNPPFILELFWDEGGTPGTVQCFHENPFDSSFGDVNDVGLNVLNITGTVTDDGVSSYVTSQFGKEYLGTDIYHKKSHHLLTSAGTTKLIGVQVAVYSGLNTITVND